MRARSARLALTAWMLGVPSGCRAGGGGAAAGAGGAGDGTGSGGAASGTGSGAGSGAATGTASGGSAGSGGVPGTGDLCSDAPWIGPGRASGRFLLGDAAVGGACDLGGPDRFLRVRPPVRADVRFLAGGDAFVPRVSAAVAGCDRPSAGEVCVRGTPGWLMDVEAGAEVLLVVGAPADEPALAGEPAWWVDVALRPVLEVGAPCHGDGSDRCVPGAACLSSEDVPRCTALEADHCGAPLDVEVSGALTQVVVDPTSPQTDAHLHSCGGARRRERVLRLVLPPNLPPTDLRIVCDAPDVGIALRAPGCEPDDEQLCAADGGSDGGGGPSAGVDEIVPRVDPWGRDGVAPLLFVELPGPPEPPAGTGAPFTVELRLEPAP